VGRQTRAELLSVLASALPEDSLILPLPLQPLQDYGITQDFKKLLLEHGCSVIEIDYAQLSLPSQWLELFGLCDLVISMRLHALIMALKEGVPVIGLAYDPKVLRLIEEFDQPCINLLNHNQPNFEDHAQSWLGVLKFGLENIEELKARADSRVKKAQSLARQNFELLATISKAEAANAQSGGWRE
jgi:polysaccharide pyruvyl transferase WcaK-like protein